MRIERAADLAPRPDRPRLGGRPAVTAGPLRLGEWSLTAAAWTDRHHHDEINWVVEGELHVTSDGQTEVLRAGDAVVVPAGSLARYAAPTFARMLYVYGPSGDGHAVHDGHYEELPAPRGES